MQISCYKKMYGGIYPSSIGDIGIMAHNDAVAYIEVFGNDKITLNPFKAYQNLCENDISKKAIEAIFAYLAGKNQVCNIALQPQGSAFERHIWNLLQNIAFGETKSYKEVATLYGNANAARAVGSACSKNPILFLIPCHRVIGSNKKLGGFRAGLALKEWLLLHEKAT